MIVMEITLPRSETTCAELTVNPGTIFDWVIKPSKIECVTVHRLGVSLIVCCMVLKDHKDISRLGV